MFVNLYTDSKIESSQYNLVYIWHFLSELSMNVNVIAQPVCQCTIDLDWEYIYIADIRKRERNLVNKFIFDP